MTAGCLLQSTMASEGFPKKNGGPCRGLLPNLLSFWCCEECAEEGSGEGEMCVVRRSVCAPYSALAQEWHQ